MVQMLVAKSMIAKFNDSQIKWQPSFPGYDIISHFQKRHWAILYKGKIKVILRRTVKSNNDIKGVLTDVKNVDFHEHKRPCHFTSNSSLIQFFRCFLRKFVSMIFKLFQKKH